MKVDGVPLDQHPNNEPHVGCTFEIDFYGYDEGDFDASASFDAQNPTGRGNLTHESVFIGEDPAGGGKDLDASVSSDLSGALAEFTPHPKQGFHVKLTVKAEGSQGADTKHKVFWVEGCAPPAVTDPTVPPTTSAPTTTTAPTPTTCVGDDCPPPE